MELLRLAALDADDLAVISAHSQDAVLKVGDLAYLPRESRFALLARRFDWNAEAEGATRRLLCGLCFDRVKHVRTRGIHRDKPDETLSLLAVTYEPKDAPSGVVTLIFSGGGAVQLDVECIEAHLKDLGPAWACESRPSHAAVAEAM